MEVMGLRPGSPEAVTSGCTCTSENNQGGKGWYGNGERFGWDISFECPLHGLGIELEALPDIEVDTGMGQAPDGT